MRFLNAGTSPARSVAHLADRYFPTPQFLVPRAAGIDISDASIKWLTLSAPRGSFRTVEAWGEAPLAAGIVQNGIVRDAEALSGALAQLKPHLGSECAHAALPEEAAYVFGMHVPRGSPHEQILRMIEFEFNGRVPIPPSEAIYDFSIIPMEVGEKDEEEGQQIGVTVFPRDLAEKYASAFEHAGISLLSLEVEARSIARAVSSEDASEPITLLVDFGRARTGFAVLKRGIPIFTSTVEVGGDALTKAAMQALSLSAEQAQVYRNAEGLLPQGEAASAGAEIFTGTASALSDEIAKHFHYWDTRRNDRGARVTPVGRVVLVGGSANLHGLPEYVAARVQAPTSLGNIWRHICSFDDYIPPIERHASLQFATAAGLALRAS